MRKFLILWLGQLLSLIGSQLTGFALGVWVYQKTQSTTLFALLTGLNVLPVIVLSPVIGTLADRWPRRRVMILSDLGAGLSTIMLAIALQFNYLPITLIALLILLNATFSSFMGPAFTAATSQLVPPEHLDRASGLMQTSTSMAQLVAPFLGGSLLYVIGLPGIIWIDVSTFLFAVLTQMLVKIPAPDARPAAATPSASPQFFRALRFLRRDPGLQGLLLFFMLKNFLTAMVYVLTTPYVLSFTSELALGTILSTGGLGMVVGGVILSFLPSNRDRIATLRVFCCLSGLTLIVLAFQDQVWTIMIGAFLFYLALPFMHGSGQVLFQKKVPLHLQGSVFACNEALAGTAIPLGYLAAGPLADYVFEPSLTLSGPLAATVGLILGVGPGRGIALFFIVLGLCHSALMALTWAYRPLRCLDQPQAAFPLQRVL